MSRFLSRHEKTEFELGDYVSFDHEGRRLTGKVARCYNTREVYHVEVEGQRYKVRLSEDNMREVRL